LVHHWNFLVALFLVFVSLIALTISLVSFVSFILITLILVILTHGLITSFTYLLTKCLELILGEGLKLKWLENYDIYFIGLEKGCD
jgi:Na+/H+ antiporter NhaC